MPLLSSYLAAAAVVVAAAAAVVAADQAVVATAAEQNQQNDDPANVAATEPVIIHRKYLQVEDFSGEAAHSMLFRGSQNVLKVHKGV